MCDVPGATQPVQAPRSDALRPDTPYHIRWPGTSADTKRKHTAGCSLSPLQLRPRYIAIHVNAATVSHALVVLSGGHLPGIPFRAALMGPPWHPGTAYGQQASAHEATNHQSVQARTWPSPRRQDCTSHVHQRLRPPAPTARQTCARTRACRELQWRSILQSC